MANELEPLNREDGLEVGSVGETNIDDLDELEESLSSELVKQFADLEFLEEEKKKIGNPDALGDVILDEVWTQFGNQIGLDMTNETLLQKYDREHPDETYESVGNKVMQDPKYKEANKIMKEMQQSGNLVDEYTGKSLGVKENANMDHVVSRKEIHENRFRKQAGIATEDLANRDKNLKPTNESLNKSKGAKSVDQYNREREPREKNLREQNERANQKIANSNLSESEKKHKIEENNKRMQDKLDADPDRMAKADKEARADINKEIIKGVTKATANKVVGDMLKQMAVSTLFLLLKRVMNAVVRFFKNGAISFMDLMKELKNEVKKFVEGLYNIIKVGTSSAISNILTTIFDPIIKKFKSITSIVKQGISSVREAIQYLTNKENKRKPFSIKVAEVGKIIVAGLTAFGAIFLGTAIDDLLLSIPFMKISIGPLGSLANIVGLFLSSLICGVMGAIIINYIDKFIANKQKSDALAAQIQKGNAVLVTQHEVRIVHETQLERDKGIAQFNIVGRHQEATAIMKDAYANIMEDFVVDVTKQKKTTILDEEDINTNDEIEKQNNALNSLLKKLK